MNVNAPPRGARTYQVPDMMQKPAMAPHQPPEPKVRPMMGMKTPMGFKVTAQHDYLKHFKNPAILAQGHNPLTEKGEKIYRNMKKEYGPKKAKSVLYASKNKGTITGID